MYNFKIKIMSSIEEINPENDNVDVNVTLENGIRYFGTFFTLSNIQQILEDYRLSGECANGKYFWATDMCIIEKIDIETMYECVQDMLDDGCFKNIFYKILD